MAEWNVVPEAQLRELAEWLVTWPWPLPEEKAVELAASHGWTVLSHTPGESVRWDTGLVGTRPWASVTILNGVASDLRVTVSEVLNPETTATKSFLRDVFADQVALLTEVLGPPAERTPGKDPEVRWILPNGAAFRVSVGLSCKWGMVSPQFVQVEADLGRR